jgi:argonaute-like protein implicated in RNA metabolism and viral defense
MSGDPTLRSIDEKLDMFMQSQKDVNAIVSKAIEKMTDTASKADVQQTEINELSKQSGILFSKYDKLNDAYSSLKTTSEINKVLVLETQDLKKMFTRSMIGVFVMFMLAIASNTFVKEPSETNKKLDALISVLEKKN